MNELAHHVRRVLRKIELINIEVDKPSVSKNRSTLVWACRELEDIVRELDRPPESRADMLLYITDSDAVTEKERINVMQDALSDFLQAKRAIVWDERSKNSRTQLSAVGMDVDQLEATLLMLAADVHHHRTRTRSGAIVVEDGQLGPLLHCVETCEITEWETLKDQLIKLYGERSLR